MGFASYWGRPIRRNNVLEELREGKFDDIYRPIGSLQNVNEILRV